MSTNYLIPSRNLLAPLAQPPKDPNQINVFELTLLLKTMGFRLNYLDYEDPKATTDTPGPSTTPSSGSDSDVTIEIKCGKRNIVSRLSASCDLCACPAKKEDHGHDSSFWEILGTAPSSSPGKTKIEETSSNLLPELSKRGVTNTKLLLGLIYDGFRKDHLPSVPTANSPMDVSPENRKEPPKGNFCTSTVVKSPMRLIHPMEDDEDPVISPSVLTVPPNTPMVGGASNSLNGNSNLQSRDHIVYLEVLAAKERLEKALLCMKMNIADDLDKYRQPGDESFQIFKEGPTPFTPKGSTKRITPERLQRRSSLGSFVNMKTKVEAANKPKPGLARNKSSVDTAAALKAKSSVASRYLQPKTRTVAATATSIAGKRMSPLARTNTVGGLKPTQVKKPANPIGAWK